MGKRGKALKRRRAGLDPPSSAAASSESANRFAAANEDDSSESDDEDEDMDADEIERSLKRRAAATSTSGDGSGAGVSVMLGGLTEHEVATAIKVVTLLGQQLDLFRSRPFKHLRVAVHPLVAEQVRRYQAAGDTNNSGDGAAASGGGNNNGASRRDDRRSRLLSAGPDAAGSNRGRLAGLAPAERLKQMDRDALNARLLRAERLEKLDALNADGEDEEVARLRVPDGVAGLMLTAGSGSMGPGGPGVAKLLTAAGSAGGSSGKGSTKFAESSEALLATSLEARGLVVHVDAPAPSAQAAKLHNSIGCYICKAPFVDLHFFYATLCPTCAALNWQKRDEMADMRGMVVIVTGARIKIGFRIALKLLRAGATVIATSRFARDAVRRYVAELDSGQWAHRLHMFGLDFRNLRMLERWCDLISERYPRLDAIVNNACQTIRRPPAYYAHLLPLECANPGSHIYRQALGSSAAGGMLSHNDASLSALIGSSAAVDIDFSADNGGLSSALNAQFSSVSCLPRQHDDDPIVSGLTLPDLSMSVAGGGTANVAVLSQAPIMTSDLDVTGGDAADNSGERAVFSTGSGSIVTTALRTKTAFPERHLDVNEQQVDVRRVNSWLLKLDQVSTGEAAEVMAINALAPFILNGRLRGLMERTRAPTSSDVSEAASAALDPRPWPKFVVNVSAMEGKFYRFKTANHPHTNMAKAALNMMTRTSAAEYAKTSDIYMTAVDTGWINDEKPLDLAAQHASTHNFQTPLDEVDAAARVLDPVMAPLLRLQQGVPHEAPSGVFLKDFQKCEW